MPCLGRARGGEGRPRVLLGGLVHGQGVPVVQPAAGQVASRLAVSTLRPPSCTVQRSGVGVDGGDDAALPG